MQAHNKHQGCWFDFHMGQGDAPSITRLKQQLDLELMGAGKTHCSPIKFLKKKKRKERPLQYTSIFSLLLLDFKKSCASTCCISTFDL